MNLRLIPIEENHTSSPKKQKFFNPGDKIKKIKRNKCKPLKEICLKLVHFINRGDRFTFGQIDDLIVLMQYSILNLQKRKQEILKNGCVRFRKKRIK